MVDDMAAVYEVVQAQLERGIKTFQEKLGLEGPWDGYFGHEDAKGNSRSCHSEELAEAPGIGLYFELSLRPERMLFKAEVEFLDGSKRKFNAELLLAQFDPNSPGYIWHRIEGKIKLAVGSVRKALRDNPMTVQEWAEHRTSGEAANAPN